MDRRLFGKLTTVEWRPAADGQVAERAVAALHHRFSLAVGEHLRSMPMPEAELARRIGMTQAHLSHVLRGNQTLTFHTVVRIIAELDAIELYPEITSLTELLDPDANTAS